MKKISSINRGEKIKQSENSDWERWLELFLGEKDKATLEMFFQLFMTMKEREVIMDRYRLVRALLTTDWPQRKIAKRLQMSISKVTAGSKATQILSDAHKSYLKNKMT